MVIYITENILTKKRYIGLDTKNNPKYLGSGKYLKRAIAKYGKDNFKKTILLICESFEELCEREKYLIGHYDATRSKEFYNIVEGGNGGWLGHEVNEKRRNTLMGHQLSDETKDKIRKKVIGRKATEETKRKMSEAQSGLIRHKDRDKLKGSNNPNSKKIGQYTLDGDLIKVWDCIKDVTDYYNKPTCKSHISACAKGKRKTTMGFKWKYVD